MRLNVENIKLLGPLGICKNNPDIYKLNVSYVDGRLGIWCVGIMDVQVILS